MQNNNNETKSEKDLPPAGEIVKQELTSEGIADDDPIIEKITEDVVRALDLGSPETSPQTGRGAQSIRQYARARMQYWLAEKSKAPITPDSGDQIAQGLE